MERSLSRAWPFATTGLLLTSFAWAADPIPVGGLGMVSAGAKSIFVPAKGGGIEALELSTGRVLWVNRTASRIAGASTKFVYAWTVGPGRGNSNGIRVMAIDASSGKTVGMPCAIPLPNWAPTTSTWGKSFQVAARADGDGAMVAWQAGLSHAGGVRPPPGAKARELRSDSGAVFADFGGGKTVPANGKPSESDFLRGPGSASFANGSVGGYEITVTETMPGLSGPIAPVTTVVLHVGKGGQKLWTREVAGKPFHPPPP